MRASNYATSTQDDNLSLQAYYVGLNSFNVTFSKYNYNYSKTNILFEQHGHNADLTDHWFKIKATVKGNSITVSLDGNEVFGYTDPQPFFNGYFGLYSEGAEVVYRNLKIKNI